LVIVMLIRNGAGPNPLKGFRVEEAQRPECILAERDGTLWAADARGGVMCLAFANNGIDGEHLGKVNFVPRDNRPVDTMLACGGSTCTLLTSLGFGGPDLSTVYLGGLRNTAIPFFRSPVPGLPMVHWS
jgi:hypothetical protein